MSEQAIPGDYKAVTEVPTSIYRRVWIGSVPKGTEPMPGVEYHEGDPHRLVWSALDNLEPDSVHELTLRGVVERFKPSQLFTFWRLVYRGCVHGAKVHVHGIHAGHQDALIDPLVKRGLLAAQFGLLSAAGRDQWRADPLHDDACLLYHDGVDFDVKMVEHLTEPQWEGRSDNAKGFAAVHYNNVVRRLRVVLEVIKPVRESTHG